MLHARFLAPLFGIVALSLAFIPGLARADVSSQQIPASLKTAIQQHIESQGKQYAGLCVDVNANPPLPFGKYCAFVLSIEHDIAEVSYGPVASNDISLVSFKLEGGTWKVMGAQTPTPSPTSVPPTATPTTPASPTSPSVVVPPALLQAIKAHIESSGKQFAGLCVDVNANPPLPFGKYCAFVLSITDGVAEVSYGPVASNDITKVKFRLENSQWKVSTTTPVTATPTHQAPQPPNTGSGNSDSDTNVVVILVVAAALFAVAGFGSLAIQRR